MQQIRRGPDAMLELAELSEMVAAALERRVSAPIRTLAFCNTWWEHEPLHVAAKDCRRFAGLFSIGEIIDSSRRMGARARRVKVFLTSTEPVGRTSSTF